MSEEARYARLAWWTLAGIALFRALYVIVFPFDLVGDEAYYWDWGRQLAWGYFSKPPLIAWLMAIAGWLGDNTDSGIRLMTVALGTGSLIFIYLLARQLWNNKAAFWAVVLVAASPGSVTINLVLTIDAPLMFFWTGALYFFYNQIHSKDYHRLWVLLTTLFLGLGLLSKQMMFAFFPLAILYLAINPNQRHQLKNWRLWFCWAIAISFLIPTVIWNMHNDWITVVHTKHHFEGKPIALVDISIRSVDFFVSQIMMLSPVTGVAVFLLAWNSLRRFRELDARTKYLLVFSVPALLVFCLMLIRQSINPNWPAVFYAGLLILLSGAINGGSCFPKAWTEKGPKWKKPIAITGIALSLFFMAVPFLLDWIKLTGAKYDPVARMEGWSELAENVQEYRETYGSELDRPFLIATGHRYMTSYLAFYLVDQPHVYHWPEQPGRIESQYELWGFPDDLESRDAFIIVPGKEAELPESLYQVFDSIEKPEPLDQEKAQQSSRRTRDYTLYIGRGLKLSSSVSEA